MLETVKIELEKEYLITIIESLTEKLSIEEKQTLNYLLQMKDTKNLLTFKAFYRRYNDSKSIKDINELLLEPLFSKKILLKTGTTNIKIYNGDNNFTFKINEKYLNTENIKRLSLQ